MIVKDNSKKIELLITIVDRGEGDSYIHLYQGFESMYQVLILGHGTANSQILDLLGLNGSDKDIVLSLIKGDQLDKVMEKLKSELKIRGKGIAFSIGLTSMIGQIAYNFLLNNKVKNHRIRKKGGRKNDK